MEREREKKKDIKKGEYLPESNLVIANESRDSESRDIVIKKSFGSIRVPRRAREARASTTKARKI